MKLLTLSDGFGDSAVGPDWYPGFLKWPELVQLMTKQVSLINLSRFGAGNEYLLQCLRKNINSADVVLIQWADARRLDLILNQDNTDWNLQITQDPVYSNNLVELGTDRYWLSSGSQRPDIRHYQKIITLRQHRTRSQLCVEHAKLLLESHNAKHGFLLSLDSEYLQESVSDTSAWMWHSAFKGMYSFRKVSKYADLDFGLDQPVSLIQFDFIKQYIMPKLDLPWRSTTEIDAVESMLYQKHKQVVKNK